MDAAAMTASSTNTDLTSGYSKKGAVSAFEMKA
jgi:hypothetical protein